MIPSEDLAEPLGSGKLMLKNTGLDAYLDA